MLFLLHLRHASDRMTVTFRSEFDRSLAVIALLRALPVVHVRLEEVAGDALVRPMEAA